ncbi:MAG: C39 family peptidase, partial [Chloroflexota bacterium]
MPKLEVPYRSQWAEDAASKDTDCGPTCAAMILNYYGVELSPDQAYEVFSRAFGWHFGRNQFTFTWHLVDLQDHFNVDSGHFTFGNQQAAITKLKAMIDEGRPFIALVNYTPWRNITNINYTGGHFVVVTGYDDEHIMMHDPLFGGNNPESNAHFKMTYSQFAAGWGGFRNPNINPDWHMIFPLSAPRREIADTDKGSSGSEGSNNQPINRVEERPAKKPVELPSEADDETKRRLEALAGWHWREVDWNDGENVLAWTNHLGGFGREIKRHRVKSGENLSVISTRYYGRQDKFKAIMAYNRMDSEMLMVDQWLRIPMPGDDEAHTTLPNLPSILQAAEAAEFFDVETEAAEYESVAENSVGMGATGPETEGAAAPADAADHNLDDSEAAGFSSVPDVVTTNIAVGQTFTGIWTFRNSGTTMWDENYKLVHVPQSLESTGGVPTAQMAAEASYPITELGASAAVLPGETITLSVQFIAPEASEITASHWQLQNGEGENFGALRWISANIVETPDVVQPPPVPEKPEEPAEPEKPEEPVKTTGPGRPFSVFIPMVGHGQQTHTVEFGMNINPNPGGGPQEIDFRDVDIQHQTGLGWVRYAYWASRNQRNSKEAYVKRYRELIKTYADAGIKTLIVLHQDTHWGNGPWDHGGWGIYAAQFAQACAE